MKNILTIKEAAEYLQKSEQYVRRLCNSDTIKATKKGKMWLVNQSSLRSYHKKNRLTPVNHVIKEPLLDETPIALSFFSGAMGLDIGIEQAGFEVALACENDKYCRQTIERNRPDVALLKDVNDISSDDVYDMAQIGKR